MSNEMRLLRARDVANMLAISTLTLRNWRARRIGPPYVKIGSAVRYAPGALIAWLESRAGDGASR